MATDITALKQRLLTRTTAEERTGLIGAALTRTAKALGAGEDDLAEALRQLQQTTFTPPVRTTNALTGVPANHTPSAQRALWGDTEPDVSAKLARLDALLGAGE